MVDVTVLGAGVFGTALALVQAFDGKQVNLCGRDELMMEEIAQRRENVKYLPSFVLPDNIKVSTAIPPAEFENKILLLAVPTQKLRDVLSINKQFLKDYLLVTCCKGVERATGLLPTEIVAEEVPGAKTAALTGPSFARDIASGRPTALTLATQCAEGSDIQARLSTRSFRLYLNDDPIGAQLGGALKNVVAIAAGVAIGLGYGESARSALMARGFSEMSRYAALRGAAQNTLYGLSGFGDLVLTCTSVQSRNFSYGHALGSGEHLPDGVTVEGVMTAHAVAESGADLPITNMVSSLLKGNVSLTEAVAGLLSRPLRNEAF